MSFRTLLFSSILLIGGCSQHSAILSIEWQETEVKNYAPQILNGESPLLIHYVRMENNSKNPIRISTDTVLLINEETEVLLSNYNTSPKHLEINQGEEGVLVLSKPLLGFRDDKIRRVSSNEDVSMVLNFTISSNQGIMGFQRIIKMNEAQYFEEISSPNELNERVDPGIDD